MTKSPSNTCETCKFAVAWTQHFRRDYAAFHCHRYPPQVVFASYTAQTGDIDHHFPLVVGTDWCGEYQQLEGDEHEQTTP